MLGTQWRRRRCLAELRTEGLAEAEAAGRWRGEVYLVIS
jgi:hypothetical protein